MTTATAAPWMRSDRTLPLLRDHLDAQLDRRDLRFLDAFEHWHLPQPRKVGRFAIE